MCADPQRDPLDHRGAEVRSRTFGSPLRHRVHRHVVVTVDTQRGGAEPESTVGERGRCAASEVLWGGDRPVVVDDVQNHWRLVRRCEHECGVEVGL